MTFFSEVNEDAKTIDESHAALGPRVGPLEGFVAGWDAQVRASAQDGMWAAYADEEDAQVQALRKAGVENIPRIGFEDWRINEILQIGPDSDFFRYKEAAKFYSGDGDEATAKRLQEHDSRIEELRKQYPDLNLRTARDMYDEVIRKGREAESTMLNQKRTFGGEVGAFFGGAVASMNPRTDPLNALTLGVGGWGKTAVARIATGAGAQSVIEGLNQITGVQGQRRMMGLSTGVEDAIGRVVGTGVGAGALQGVGELAVFAGKRWFRNTPNDPAPPAPEPYKPKEGEPLLLEYKPANWAGRPEWEADVKAYQDSLIQDLMAGARDYTDDIIPMANYGRTRQGAARARLDMDYVASRLDAWDGEMPFQIKPKSSTSLPQRVGKNYAPEVRINTPGADLDAIAREIDPKLFNVYDDLAKRKSEYQRWLEDPRFVKERDATVKRNEALIEELSTKIDNLKYNMGRVGKRKQANMQPKLDALLEEKRASTEKLTRKDTPEMAAIRRELIATDEKMRDLVPVVSRAYAHAQNKWDLGEQERELVRQMVRESRTDLPKKEEPVLRDTYENTAMLVGQTLHERAPILKESYKVEARMKPGSDAADYAKAIIEENQKVIDEALQVYRDSLDSIVTSEKDGVVTINGEAFKFDLDRDTIYVPNEDGEGVRRVTIRELLEENADAEAELKATQTCSIL